MSAPVFKKRNPSGGGNVRKRKVAEDGDDLDEEDVADVNRLRQIKQLQEARARKNGVSLEDLAQSDGKRSKGDSMSGAERTVETLLGTQFSVRVEDGLGSGIAHEKIMEKYIEDKLGEGKVVQKERVARPDDEIYRIPDELKVEVVTTETVKSNDGDVVAGWSTGIAEVALPQTFKLKNIVQTEAAARRIQEQEQIQEIMRRNANSNMSFSRFHVQDHEQREMSSALVPAEDPQDSKGRRREEKATDLKVFQGYKKRQQAMKR